MWVFLWLCICRHIMTGSYNNFFRMFDRDSKRDSTLEACREITKPRTVLKLRKVCTGGKRKKDEISVDCLDFNKKILHTGWHPLENIIAIAATNNLYIFCSKDWPQLALSPSSDTWWMLMTRRPPLNQSKHQSPCTCRESGTESVCEGKRVCVSVSVRGRLYVSASVRQEDWVYVCTCQRGKMCVCLYLWEREIVCVYERERGAGDR